MLRNSSQGMLLTSTAAVHTVHENEHALTGRNVKRLKILVISEEIDFLQQISCVFSPEFILQYKAKIKISSSLSQAIHEVESEYYDLILMEGELNGIGGVEFVAFARSDESLSNRAKIITVKKHIDFYEKITREITCLSR